MSTIKVDTYLTRGGASEIAIDKLKGASSAGSMLVVGEGGTTTTNLQQGLNKVWLQYDQGTTAIQDSFNVSSITDNAVGSATTTYTNNMNSTSYAIGGSCQANGFLTVPAAGPDTDNTGALVTVSNGGNDVDYNNVGPSVQGDLA
jgi:hypothetical protein